MRVFLLCMLAVASGQRGTHPGGVSHPAILRLNNEHLGDGSYRFDYQTENQISQQEIGQVKNPGTKQQSQVVQGSYSYTGPDGVVYTVNYIADENGFRASGAHLPTISPEINDGPRRHPQNPQKTPGNDDRLYKHPQKFYHNDDYKKLECC